MPKLPAILGGKPSAQELNRQRLANLEKTHGAKRRVLPWLLPAFEIVSDTAPTELGALPLGSKVELRNDPTAALLLARWLRDGRVKLITISEAEKRAAFEAMIPELTGE